MDKLDKQTIRYYNQSIITILIIITTVVASGHGFFREISSASDQDFILIYNALRMNDGLPQTYFDHTGYTYFLILSQWFEALNLFNIIPLSKISQLPELEQFEPMWAKLVYAGRSLSILLSILASILFYFILKMVIKNQNLAAIFAILFAISPGLVRQSLIMRTELPSFVFFIIALFFTLRAGRSKIWREFFFVFLAAFFATMATMAKMQIIPIILSLPLVGLLINVRMTRFYPPAHLTYPLPIVSSTCLILIAISIPSFVMIWTQTFPALPEIKSVSHSGYQFLILLYFIITTAFYILLDKRSVREFTLAISFIACGMAIAFYSNFFSHNIINTEKLVNFIDNMSLFARQSLITAPSSVPEFNLFATLFLEFKDALITTIYKNFLVFDIFSLPYTLMYWGSALAMSYFFVHQKWRLFLVIGLFISISIGMEAFSGFRSYLEHYRIYYEIWILLASAIISQFTLKPNILKNYEKNVLNLIPTLLIIIMIGYTTFGSIVRATTNVDWQTRENACFQMKSLIPYFCSQEFLNNEKR